MENGIQEDSLGLERLIAMTGLAILDHFWTFLVDRTVEKKVYLLHYICISFFLVLKDTIDGRIKYPQIVIYVIPLNIYNYFRE